MGERLESRDWLLDRLLSVAAENERKLVWLIGAFLVLSFVAIAMNLGSIGQTTINLLFLETGLEDTWPIRLLLTLGAQLAFLIILHFFFELQKAIAGLNYLGLREHDRATEIAQFGAWIVANAPGALVAQARVVVAIQISAVAILTMVWISFIYSLFA
jgi:hypothetical protein